MTTTTNIINGTPITVPFEVQVEGLKLVTAIKAVIRHCDRSDDDEYSSFCNTDCISLKFTPGQLEIAATDTVTLAIYRLKSTGPVGDNSPTATLDILIDCNNALGLVGWLNSILMPDHRDARVVITRRPSRPDWFMVSLVKVEGDGDGGLKPLEPDVFFFKQRVGHYANYQQVPRMVGNYPNLVRLNRLDVQLVVDGIARDREFDHVIKIDIPAEDAAPEFCVRKEAGKGYRLPRMPKGYDYEDRDLYNPDCLYAKGPRTSVIFNSDLLARCLKANEWEWKDQILLKFSPEPGSPIVVMSGQSGGTDPGAEPVEPEFIQFLMPMQTQAVGPFSGSGRNKSKPNKNNNKNQNKGARH